MSIPKHEPSKKTKGTKKTRLTLADMPHVDPATEYRELDYRNSRCVAEAIDGFASIFSTFVTQARNGDNSGSLYTTPTGYPVKVALTSLDGDEEACHSVEIELTGTAIHSIADSLKRIADAMTKE